MDLLEFVPAWCACVSVRRPSPGPARAIRALRSLLRASSSSSSRSAVFSWVFARLPWNMSARATRATARAHESERSTLLSLPLRVAALSWGLGTLPLTATLLLLGKLTELCDALLAVVGLTRRGRAAAMALAAENALRAQLRSSATRLKARVPGSALFSLALADAAFGAHLPAQTTQEQLARSETSRRMLERELGLQRCAPLLPFQGHGASTRR